MTASGPASSSPRTRRFWWRLSRYTLALLLVACGAAAFAIVFRSAINFVFGHLYPARDVLTAFAELPLHACVLVPAVGGGLAGLTASFASRVRGGAGVGQVMEAVVLGGVRISLRFTLIKALGSWLAIVSGGSVGREGSIIQFGGGLGGTAARLFRLDEGHARSLVAAGTAAGFAAAYNTPLAAVLFVSEIVTGVIALDVVLPAIVATPLATALTRLAIGGGPIYGEHTFRLASDVELLVPAGLGLLAGVVGPAFMWLLARAEAWFGALPMPRPARAALGGLVVGGLAVWLPQVTGNGYEAINLLLRGRFALGMMLVLLVTKAIATTASVSSGSPGGVFTPSLFIGAALGGVVGQLSGMASGRNLVEGYALIGMAAMTAATTHAPVMAAVMVFELSGDYAIVLPLLVATALATLLSRRIRPLSIYGEELLRHGVAWDITIEGRRMRRVAAPPDGPEARGVSGADP